MVTVEKLTDNSEEKKKEDKNLKRKKT